MTSEARPSSAYVWTWLPEQPDPIVAGLITADGDRYLFNYGQSYLARKDAIPLYVPELPLRQGAIPPGRGLQMAGCLRDASPDAWGRRVVVNRLVGAKREAIDVGQVDELSYLLESGSDRVGALDFQASSNEYRPREAAGASYEELMEAVRRVEAGVPLTPELDRALFHGSSIGGARPKALITDHGRKYVAKFSSQSDVFNVVKGEYVAMRLAERAGLRAAPVRLERAAGRDILLVERFDRERLGAGWARKAMVSALTLFELDEMMARYASYEELCSIVRHRFTAPEVTLRELFARLVFNILVGNTDDHARNHAAFWDGQRPTLTPAYDICPQGRAGNEATQAMAILGAERLSQLSLCRRAAGNFLLSELDADAIIIAQVQIIRRDWAEVCDEAALSEVDRAAMWRRQVLNPFAFEGLPGPLSALGA